MSADPVWSALVGARWLHFASLDLLFGSSTFFLFAGRGISPTARSRRLTAAALRVAAPLAVVSGLAWLDASLAGMTGSVAATFDPGFLQLFFFDTPFGGIEIGRLALIAALAAATALPQRQLFAVAAALSGALLVSQAWLGHAADAGAAGGTIIASYILHVLAGAIWLGGLPALLFALADDRASGVLVLGRFSVVATLAAAVVLASGAANTAFHAGWDVAALLDSGYGRVLAVKLAFVAAMLLLAAVTRFRSLPRLRRGGREKPSRLVAWEGVAGLCVLLAAAVLGITAPPH